MGRSSSETGLQHRGTALTYGLQSTGSSLQHPKTKENSSTKPNTKTGRRKNNILSCGESETGLPRASSVALLILAVYLLDRMGGPGGVGSRETKRKRM